MSRKVTVPAIIMVSLGAIFYYYEYYLRVAPSVMSQELMQAFDISESHLGLVAAYYYYSYIGMQLPVGMLIDKYGAKRILSLACLSCVVATFVFSAANTVHEAYASRFLVGFGSAFAYVGVLKIASLWLPHRYFAFIAGLCTTLGMIGGISGQNVMTLMIAKLDWRSTLWYTAIAGIVINILLLVFLKDKPIKLQHTLEHEVISLRKEIKKIMSNKQMWMVGLIGALTFLPISTFAEMWAIPYFCNQGYSKEQAAIITANVFLGFAVGAPLIGALSNKWHSRKLLLMIGSTLGAVFLGIPIVFSKLPLVMVAICMFLGGVLASAQILVFAISGDIYNRHIAATAASFINMLVMLGGALLLPLMGKILFYTQNNYRLAALTIPLALIIAAALCGRLTETYRQHDE